MKRKKKAVGGGKGVVSLLERIQKKFGKEVVMRMGDVGASDVEVIPTGSVGLDAVLGVGGLPRGRVIEIYGPESSGKTTLTLHAVANAQRAGVLTAFIDAEHSIDPAYARALGVDVDNLLVSQPDCGEDALEIACELAKSGEVGLIVIDSVAALTPRAEIDGDMSQNHVGLQARLMGQGLRKLVSAANQNSTTIIFTNQLRQKIGVMFGSGETTPGGNALKFYASVRLDVRRIQTIREGDKNVAIANKTRCKVIKNKVSPPYGEAIFEIRYGIGICPASEVLDLGVEHGIIDKSGSWYSYEGRRLGQGRERSRATLLEDDALRAVLREKVLAVMLPNRPQPADAVTPRQTPLTEAA